MLSTKGIAAPLDTFFGFYPGYSLVSLSRTTNESFASYTIQANAGCALFGLNVHAFFQHTELTYRTNGLAAQGLYALSGVGVGYQIAPSKLGFGSINAQYPLSTNYTYLTESSSTVNDDTYIISELTTLTGGQAFQIHGGYNLRLEGSGTNKKGENFHMGVHFAYLRQNFSSQATRIKSNNSVLAPASSGTKEVDYGVSVISLFLTAVYDI